MWLMHLLPKVDQKEGRSSRKLRAIGSVTITKGLVTQLTRVSRL